MRRPENSNFFEQKFLGFDKYNPAQNIPAGFLRSCENLVTEGAADGDGGELVTRRGKRGQFTTKFNTPLYWLQPVQQADGTVIVLFTTNGRLYKTVKGSATYTEITLSGGASMGLVSANTWMVSAGGRIYIGDGVGALKYTDLTTGYSVATLAKPTAGPTALLTSLPLLPTPGTLSWVQDQTSFGTGGGELVSTANSNFQTGFWTTTGDTSNTLDANGDPCVELDDIGEYALSSAVVPLNTGGGTPRYGRVFRLQFEHAAEDTGSNNPTERVFYQLRAFSDTGGTASIYNSDLMPSELAGENPSVKTSRVIDFRQYATDPASLKVFFVQQDDHGGTKGTDVNRVHLVSKAQVLSLSATPAGELLIRQGTVESQDGVLLTGGLRLFYDLGGATDWSKKGKLILNLRPGSGVSNLRARLYFRQAGTDDFDAAARYYTNELTMLDSGTEASIDITTVDTANRSSFRYLGIEFLDDVLITGVTETSALTVLTLGAITEAGNLPVGYADVTYLQVEVDASGDPVSVLDILQSDGSPRSNAITPDERRAVGQLTFPARTNAAATHIKTYRFGGTFGDGRGRLVASFPFAQASFAFGAAPAVGILPVNPYLKWTAPGGGTGTAGGVLLDNTPDSWLFAAAEFYEVGRQSPPSGAQAGAEFANRLWLLVGATLYGSWLLTESKKNGLYYTTDVLDVIGDPSAKLKGFTSPVGGDVKDPGVALCPYKDRLVITKANSRPYLLLGTNPANFELRAFTGAYGVGQSARLAIVVWHDAIHYLGPDGIVRFDTYTSEPRGRRLQRLLNGNLVAGGASLSATAYAKCFMFVHGGDLYLGAPGTSADANNTVLYRFDGALNDLVPTTLTPFAMTGGTQASGTADTTSLLLAGQNGQLYDLGGTTGDKETPAGSASAIDWKLETRRWGQESSGIEKRALFFLLDVETGAEATTLTFSVDGQKPSVDTWTHNYTLPAGGGPFEIRKSVKNNVRGRLLSARLSSSSKLPARIRMIGLDYAPGRVKSGV